MSIADLMSVFFVFFPSSSFNLPPAPVFSDEPQSESSQSLPPKSPLHSPPQTSIVALPTPGSPTEPKHDVPYFRWLFLKL